MANFVTLGDNLTFTADKEYLFGDLFVKGTIVGVVITPAVTGGVVVVCTSGVFNFETDADLEVGAKAYATPTGTITGTASGNTAIGVVVGKNAGSLDIKL